MPEYMGAEKAVALPWAMPMKRQALGRIVHKPTWPAKDRLFRPFISADGVRFQLSCPLRGKD